MTVDIRHDATPEPAGGVGDHEAATALAIGIKIGTDLSIAVGAYADGWAGTVTRPTVELAGRDDFLHRIGDPVGLVDAAGDPVFAEALYAQAVHRLLTEILDATGADPQTVHVTFAVPDGWSPAVIADVGRAVQAATGLTADRCDWTSAAVTAVTAAEHSTGAFADGDPVVVYDFGASATTVTVLAAGTDPTPLTRPLTSTLVSGRDIDRLLLDHTLEATGLGHTLGASVDNLSILADLTELRGRCRTAKERLSTDTGTAVDISVGEHRTQARLVREDVDELVRGPVLESVSLVRDALAAAGVNPRRVAAIVAVGGGSSVPIVSELLESALHIPVILDPDPSGAAAVGAALISADCLAADRLAAAGGPDDATALLAAAAPLPAPAPIHAVEPAPVSESAPAQRLSNRKRGVLVALGVAVIAVFTAAGLSVGTGLVGSTKPATPAPAEGAVPSGAHGASTPARSTAASAAAGGPTTSRSGGAAATTGTAGRTATTGAPTSTAAGAPAASSGAQPGQPAASTAAPQPSTSNGGTDNGGATNGGTGSGSGTGNTDTGGTDDGSGGGTSSGGSGSGNSGSGGGIGGAVRQLPGDVLGGVGQITCGLVGLPACP
ncbi:Hsp70 family protein [Gordonia sp. L191]|uniref:Hsp70 family protein n=1 Tax=Gordonia sp. L191 TaxID=2982699 RepID=UPI0024C0B492|nr:Hsp70 family protein [Gordonia sp. L191]WHU46410.1 Hsp70 family protein [Gordonia sp. L191]